MKLKLFFTLLAFLFAHLIYAQTADVTTGCSPVSVHFTHPSTSSTAYWDFGDGGAPATQLDPNRVYNVGTFTVTFRETSGGPVIGSTIVITVYPRPTIQITTQPSPANGCSPLNVTFTAVVSNFPASGVSNDGYSWDFGDNTPGSGVSVIHSYNSTSTNTFNVNVSLQTTPATCQTTSSAPTIVTCSAPPVASFTADPSFGCSAPLNVNFINNSSSPLSLTYAWDFNDGSPIVTSQTPPQKTYTTTGNNTVKLKVTDPNGCTDETTQTISVGTPVTTDFIADGTVCTNAATTFTNTSTPGSYLWTFDAGTSITLSAATNPTVSFSTPGTHTITLTTSVGSCSSAAPVTKTIFVEDAIATFTTIPTYACENHFPFHFIGSSPNTNIKSWNWTMADGKIKTGANLNDFSYTYSIPDSLYQEEAINYYKTTSLSITTLAGCVSPIVSVTDTINLPWARFMPDTSQGCAPLTVTFSDSSHSKEKIVKWEWDYNADGIIDKVINSPNSPTNSHTFSTPGTYSVSLTITNSRGCKDMSYYIVIKVGAKKTFDFSAPASVCPGDPVNLSLSSSTDIAGVTAWHYSSNSGQTLNGQPLSHCFNSSNATVVLNDAVGPQTISLTAEYNGCLTTVTHTVTVKGPIAHFDYLLDCAKRTPFVAEFTDKSQGATNLSWNFGDGSPLGNANGTFGHTYNTVPNDYKITLTATSSSSGCPASKDSAIVHASALNANFTTTYTNSPSFCKGVSYTFDGSSSTDEFVNCYRGYTWIFSDKLIPTATSASPVNNSVKFVTSGNQSIGLVVQDINGCSDTLLKNIQVFGITAKYAISDNSICLPAILTYTDQSVSDATIAKWNWKLGGVNTSTLSAPNPVTYNSPMNSFTTTLTVTDVLGCTSTTTQMVSTYTPSSTISISPSPNICLGMPVTVNASQFTSQGSSLKYTWNLGDGAPTTTVSPLPHTYNAAGTYTVNLSYTEIGSGCSGSTQSAVTVQSKPIASYTASQPNPICYTNPSVTFTNTSTPTNVNSPITSFNWYIDGGSAITQNPMIYTFAKRSAPYPIRLVVNTASCQDDTTINWKLVDPKGTFGPINPTICKGDSVRFTVTNTSDITDYYWDFGVGGSLVYNTSPVTYTYTVLPPNGYVVAHLVLVGGGSCNPVSNDTVFIRYVKADFMRNSGLDTVLCFGKADTLTNHSSSIANSFIWNFGDGTSTVNSLTKATQYHTYASPGTYSITLTASNTTYGCPDDTTEIVIIKPLPIITATGDTICKDNRAHLLSTQNSFYTYVWTPPGELNSATVYNPNLTGTESETFTVGVTDTNKCVNTATALLYVVQPLNDISFDTSIVVGDVIKLPITKQNDMVHFSWTPETGLSCTDCAFPQIQPLEDITYNVTMTDSCMSKNGIFVIHVKPEMFIELPTTFTPNGDGANDIIYVKGWGIKDLLSFEIYNRWGELVFTTSDLAEGWNGYYKGMLQNNDTYVWKVKALTWRNTTLGKEGHFNLMR